MTAPGIKVKRAQVLTLWAAVVAERLGHPPDLAAYAGPCRRGFQRSRQGSQHRYGGRPRPRRRETRARIAASG
jgi:hypothetical protein